MFLLYTSYLPFVFLMKSIYLTKEEEEEEEEE
jgi:hypothetical protein